MESWPSGQGDGGLRILGIELSSVLDIWPVFNDVDHITDMSAHFFN